MNALERACAALLIASAIGGASCMGAPDAEPTRTTAEPIIGGDADAADVAVVALKQTSTGDLCSGTLIAPSLVLTAAHCVHGVAAADLQVLVGQDVTSPTQTLAASAVVTYPTYADEATGLAGGVDLAVVELAQPSSVTPVSLDTTTTDEELADAAVTLVGFGVSSTIDDTQTGVRRSVSTSVTSVCTRILTLGDDEADTCFGDSGGAVLLGGKLVAVISSGQADCIAPSKQTRLSAHATWLASVLAGTPAAPCPSCVKPDPSCGAATETAPAVSVDAAVADATESADAAPSPGATAHGGCSASPGASPGAGAVPLAALALLLRARKRPGPRRGSRTWPASPR